MADEKKSELTETGNDKSTISRKKVGLALGSGAARGLAHIGVIKALKENGIQIDYIAGTSVGALVGAYYSLNGDVDNLEKKMKTFTKKDLIKLIDLVRPKKGIIKGDKVKKFLEELYGKNDFSDTKIPLNIIAADLHTGDEVIISSGNLIEAVRASISIPGIFTPVEMNGKTLVDGGIVNNTPIDTVKKMGADVIIAVDLPVSTLGEKTELDMFGVILQSFEIMRSRLNNFKTNDTTIILYPKFNEKISGYQFYNKEYIVEGERIANEAMPSIKKMVLGEK